MYFLNQMDIKGMTLVLCGFVFIIFPKNLLSVSIAPSMWHPIPCRVYLPQIVHQWPFSMSLIILPHPQLLFWKNLVIVFLLVLLHQFKASWVAIPYRCWRGQNTWMVKVKDNLQSVTWQDFVFWFICIRRNYPVTFASFFFFFLNFWFHSLPTSNIFPKNLSDWQICTICKGRRCSDLKSLC